jgi:Carboxypeptidase regulatory-like domain
MKRPFGRTSPGWLVAEIMCLSAFLLPCPAARAQAPQNFETSGTISSTSAAPQQDQQTSGIISGTVVDKTGAAVAGARVKLTPGESPAQETLSDSDGQFFFTNVVPGPFQLSITAQGFMTESSSGTLHSGEDDTMPPIEMTLASVVTEIHVSPAEEAKIELEAEEKQRVLGVIPNFYVTYVPDAAPLAPKQKFELAWKSTIDPVTFVLNAGTAGFEQAANYYSGYGQGAQGYLKRYGASYADFVTSTFIGSAILPALLKQDPRYFYKGTGSTRSRVLYSLVNAVICKGDNGRWQANYSNIVGNFAASGIANAYYPASDRGAATTVESALIGIGASGAGNFIEEFVVPKLTSIPHPGSSKPPRGGDNKPGI